MRIAISPDENPGDPGSVAADGTTERSVNLKVATALSDVLRRCGQDAWFDPNITFNDRVAKANSDGTNLLVACAHNESTPGRSGTEFVFCEGGLQFGKQAQAADAVYQELAKLPDWPPRRPNVVEAVAECCNFNSDTVYIEFLFMSPEDRVISSRPNYAQDVAEAVARGLASTYGFPFRPDGNSHPDEGFPYTVKHGDTLSAIARRCGITWQQLHNFADNHSHIPNPDLIHPGDVIRTPCDLGG
jgi:N-acetylmuramoyl-L-alanine amidase